MSLSEDQIRRLYSHAAKFPSSWPELARLEIRDETIPAPDKPDGDPVEGDADYVDRDIDAKPIKVFVATEAKEDLVSRVIPLCDVLAVFLPRSSKKRKIKLTDGVWLMGPQVNAENLDIAKGRVHRKNRQGLGIVFVSNSAQVLNVISIGASAAESGRIDPRLVQTMLHPAEYPEPCCGGGPCCRKTGR